MNCVPSLPSPLAHAYLIGGMIAMNVYGKCPAYLCGKDGGRLSVYRRAATLWPLPFL